MICLTGLTLSRSNLEGGGITVYVMVIRLLRFTERDTLEKKIWFLGV